MAAFLCTKTRHRRAVGARAAPEVDERHALRQGLGPPKARRPGDVVDGRRGLLFRRADGFDDTLADGVAGLRRGPAGQRAVAALLAGRQQGI